MAGLKELRTRIETIKSTEKITSAMKMVAAARLRRSQGIIEKCRFYNNNILASANRVLFELRQEEQKKKTLRETQQAAQAAKAVKAAKAATSTTEAGRVGDRPYARGRAYKADRYDET